MIDSPMVQDPANHPDPVIAMIARALDSDVRLLILAANVTQSQLEERHPGILLDLSIRAARAAERAMRVKIADQLYAAAREETKTSRDFGRGMVYASRIVRDGR